MNVRYQTGMHAAYLNDLRRDLQDNLLMKNRKKSKLKERLGHTPIEVLGGIVFGICFTFILYYMLYV